MSAVKVKTYDQQPLIVRIFAFVVILFVFLVSLKLMGAGFKLMGKDHAQSILEGTANPIVALFVGVLATAIIQSSSTTTSMIVVMVAARTINLEQAVPLILGANIGTSVTSTIIAFGHVGSRKEYRKAVASATVHDFFNILCVSILFPLELFFGILSGPAKWLTSGMTVSDEESEGMFNIMSYTVKPVAKWIEGLLGMNEWFIIIVGVGLLFITLRMLTYVLKTMVINKAQENLNKVVFGNPILALGWGAGLTVLVQSSSVTTSLMVPIVAANKVSIKRAFPFMMGANIGTTTTAIIVGATGNVLGFQVALVHFFFNIIGVFIFFPIPMLRDFPVMVARRLGRASAKNRIVGFAYVLIMFFIIPFTLIAITS